MKKRYIIGLIVVLAMAACVDKKVTFSTHSPEYYETGEYNLTGIDTLVDIGCREGDFTKYMISWYPSLFFVLEDLSQYRDYGSNKQYDTHKKVTRTLSRWKDKFTFVAGFEDSIPLPSNSCKKVLCRKTVHEFNNVKKMVLELTRILGNDGELIIVEPEPIAGHEYDEYCKRKHLTTEEIIKIFGELKLLKASKIPYKQGKIVWQMAVLRFAKN